MFISACVAVATSFATQDLSLLMSCTGSVLRGFKISAIGALLFLNLI